MATSNNQGTKLMLTEAEKLEDEKIYTPNCVVCGLPDTGGGVYRANGYHHWDCSEYERAKEEIEVLKKKVLKFERSHNVTNIPR